MSDADSDWLASDGDEAAPLGARMEQRDRLKAERLFETEGWREGISAGTAAALQPAFNKAFNEVGAPLGRRVGRIRGIVDALARALRSTSSALASASPASVPEENNEGQATLAALDRIAERLGPLDWTTLSYPILDPHKDGLIGDHNEPPPNLPDASESGAALPTHPHTPDPQIVQHVEQARRELESLEQQVAQLQAQALRVHSRSMFTNSGALEPRSRARRGQTRKVPSAGRVEDPTGGTATGSVW